VGDWETGTGTGNIRTEPRFPVPVPSSRVPVQDAVERRLDFRLYTLPTTAGPITRLNTESRYEASLNFWDVRECDGDIPPNILRDDPRPRLILLINPSFVPDEGRERYYMRFFDRTLGRLKFALADAERRRTRAVPTCARTHDPVAVCLSQIDRAPQFMDAEPKALFQETVGDTAPVLYSSLTTFDSFNASLGTSFAAPLVAGTVALMVSVDPTLTPAQVKAALQATARPFPSSGSGDDVVACKAPSATEQLECYCTSSTCGAGMLDAAAA
jgi:subtilisin family serine protease